MIYYIYNYTENAVKIGYSKSMVNLWLRYETLQVGSATILILLKYEQGSLKEEQIKHKQYQHLRIRGEWFKIVDELLDYINPDIDINPVYLKTMGDNYIHEYHAKKYNRNIKITFRNIRSACQSHYGGRHALALTNHIYQNIVASDTLENIKTKVKQVKKHFTIKRSGKVLEDDTDRIKEYFVYRENHYIDAKEVKDYLTFYNFKNKSRTGTLPVTKVAKIFNTTIIVKKIKGKATRCLVGLDFKIKNENCQS